jgi:serine/threonine protein kinase
MVLAGAPDEACPAKDMLSEFAIGEVDDADFAVVARHVEFCAECLKALCDVETPANPFVDALRDGRPDPWVDERECEALQAWASVLTVGCGPLFDGTDPIIVPTTGVGAPARIGPYELVHIIGEGGMGVVYQAIHVLLGKKVALKILPLNRTNPGAVRRFQREWRALGALGHPHIVAAVDAGECDGFHFLATEFVEGCDLSIIKGRTPLSWCDACELVRQAALGLACIHGSGLVHRDIKPSNLMLGRDGRLKILDFGLALLKSSNPDSLELTAHDQIVGTADYIAPEQTRNSHDVDVRADLYSLGCTFYCLLCGAPPFHRVAGTDRQDRLRAHSELPVPAIQQRRPDLPAAIVAIVDKLLAKDRLNRYASAQELADLLAAHTAEADLSLLAATLMEPSAVATGIPTKPRGSRARRRVVAATCSLAILATAATLGLNRGRQADIPANGAVDLATTAAAGAGSPRALVWPAHSPASIWKFDSDANRLWLSCSGSGLLSYGKCTHRNFTIRATVHQITWGDAGIFWGYAPATFRGKPCIQFQSVDWTPEKQNFTIRHKLLHTLADGQCNQRVLSQQSIPADPHSHRIEAVVKGGELAEIRWDDAVFTNFPKPDLFPGTVLESSGQYGVYCDHGSCTYDNFTLSTQEQ